MFLRLMQNNDRKGIVFLIILVALKRAGWVGMVGSSTALDCGNFACVGAQFIWYCLVWLNHVLPWAILSFPKYFCHPQCPPRAKKGLTKRLHLICDLSSPEYFCPYQYPPWAKKGLSPQGILAQKPQFLRIFWHVLPTKIQNCAPWVEFMKLICWLELCTDLLRFRPITFVFLTIFFDVLIYLFE